MKAWAAAAAALAVYVLAAAPASAAMGKMVTVASGQIGEVRWAFGVAGGNGQRCYGDLQIWPGPEGSGYVEEANGRVCEDASAPRGEWRQITGVSFEDGPSIELFQTSARVHRLELLLTPPRGNPYEPRWRGLRTKGLTRAERTKAKLGPGYRFAALSSADPFCVTAVKTFDREGDLLRERQVPCEY